MEVWIKADEGEWEDVKPIVVKALESGVDCILTTAEHSPKIKELGAIKTAVHYPGEGDVVVVGKGTSFDGTKPIEEKEEVIKLINSLKKKGYEVGAFVVIRGKEYEMLASELGGICDYVIVVSTDWKIIPLENLIAALQPTHTKLIASVSSAEEAKLAFETLEVGADGVLLSTRDPNVVVDTMKVVESLREERIELVPARIINIEQVGMGDRVCIDTCAIMQVGEGMLIGSQANGFFLVHSESEDSPYVAARPFRVNAGAVHAYIKVGDRTKYLAELKSGDEVMVVSRDGKARREIVGRVKIERRPLILVEAEVGGRIIKTILQNAETIKLVSKDGNPVSVASLKEGDEVLVHVEEVGRHFGMGVKETIIER